MPSSKERSSLSIHPIEEWVSDDEGSTDRGKKSTKTKNTPDDAHVCFETPRHRGTIVFDMAVKSAVAKFGNAKFSGVVFNDIKGQLEGRKYYIHDQAVGIDGVEFWREATTMETMFHFEKAFTQEQTNAIR